MNIVLVRVNTASRMQRVVTCEISCHRSKFAVLNRNFYRCRGQSYFLLDSHDSVILYVHFYCRFEDKNLSGWRHAQQTSRSRQIATSWYPLRTPVAHIQRDLLAFTNSAIQLSVRIANEEFPTAHSSLMSPEIDSMATSCHSIPVASWETRCSALIELRNQHCSSRR